MRTLSVVQKSEFIRRQFLIERIEFITHKPHE